MLDSSAFVVLLRPHHRKGRRLHRMTVVAVEDDPLARVALLTVQARRCVVVREDRRQQHVLVSCPNRVVATAAGGHIRVRNLRSLHVPHDERRHLRLRVRVEYPRRYHDHARVVRLPDDTLGTHAHLQEFVSRKLHDFGSPAHGRRKLHGHRPVEEHTNHVAKGLQHHHVQSRQRRRAHIWNVVQRVAAGLHHCRDFQVAYHLSNFFLCQLHPFHG